MGGFGFILLYSFKGCAGFRVIRFPDAVQRHLTVHRRAGTVTNTVSGTTPALQRTASQGLRAALRPGNNGEYRFPLAAKCS